MKIFPIPSCESLERKTLLVPLLDQRDLLLLRLGCLGLGTSIIIIIISVIFAKEANGQVTVVNIIIIIILVMFTQVASGQVPPSSSNHLLHNHEYRQHHLQSKGQIKSSPTSPFPLPFPCNTELDVAVCGSFHFLFSHYQIIPIMTIIIIFNLITKIIFLTAGSTQSW